MKKTARQVIQASTHGSPPVNFTRPQPRRARSLPDFAAAARADGAGPAVGDRLLKRLLADEALS